MARLGSPDPGRGVRDPVEQRIFFASPQEARHVRLRFTGRSDNRYRLYTVSVFGDAAAPPAAPVNVALGKAVTAANYQNYAANLTDGSPKYWYSAARDDQWVEMDLGASRSLDRMTIKWVQHAITFRVEASTDGITWAQIHDGTFDRDEAQAIAFGAPIEARYVRLVLTCRSQSRYQIDEIEVFEAAP